nr:hypothetical protein [uncultured Neokomagataea sp.]
MNSSFVDFSGVFNAIPQQYESWMAFFIIFCKLITVIMPPPVSNSYLYNIYKMISFMGLNIGWASNCLGSIKEKELSDVKK